MKAQPYIITVGPSEEQIEFFYVCINTTLYTLPSLFEAFKTCFNTFHVFNAQYPVESRHLWLVIQKILFEIHTPWDVDFSHTGRILKLHNEKKIAANPTVQPENETSLVSSDSTSDNSNSESDSDLKD